MSGKKVKPPVQTSTLFGFGFKKAEKDGSTISSPSALNSSSLSSSMKAGGDLKEGDSMFTVTPSKESSNSVLNSSSDDIRQISRDFDSPISPLAMRNSENCIDANLKSAVTNTPVPKTPGSVPKLSPESSIKDEVKKAPIVTNRFVDSDDDDDDGPIPQGRIGKKPTPVSASTPSAKVNTDLKSSPSAGPSTATPSSNASKPLSTPVSGKKTPGSSKSVSKKVKSSVKSSKKAKDSDEESEYSAGGGESESSGSESFASESDSEDVSMGEDSEEDVKPGRKRAAPKTPSKSVKPPAKKTTPVARRSPTTADSPLADGDGDVTLSSTGVFSAGQHAHNSYEFLKPQNRRDASGRPPSHPLFNPRTLFVPPDFLRGLTPAQAQWWAHKAQNMDTILFFRQGKFYETYHMDSDVAVRVLGLVYMRGAMAHAGFPEISYGAMSDKLVLAGFRVARVEQTETPEQLKERNSAPWQRGPKDKAVRRELCGVKSRGTRSCGVIDVYAGRTSDDLSSGAAEANQDLAYGDVTIHANTNLSKKHLVSLKEVPLPVDPANGSAPKEVLIGFTVVDTLEATVRMGSFVDHGDRSILRTLLARFPPAELLLEADRRLCGPGNGAGIRLSKPTRTLLRAEAGDAVISLLGTGTEFWSGFRTFHELSGSGRLPAVSEVRAKWKSEPAILCSEDFAEECSRLSEEEQQLVRSLEAASNGDVLFDERPFQVGSERLRVSNVLQHLILRSGTKADVDLGEELTPLIWSAEQQHREFMQPTLFRTFMPVFSPSEDPFAGLKDAPGPNTILTEEIDTRILRLRDPFAPNARDLLEVSPARPLTIVEVEDCHPSKAPQFSRTALTPVTSLSELRAELAKRGGIVLVRAIPLPLLQMLQEAAGDDFKYLPPSQISLEAGQELPPSTVTLSAFGATLYWLRRGLIDHHVLSMRRISVYTHSVGTSDSSLGDEPIRAENTLSTSSSIEVGHLSRSASLTDTCSVPPLTSFGSLEALLQMDLPHMLLDGAAMTQLELVEAADPAASSSRQFTLFRLVDRCSSKGGRSLLRLWVQRPLLRAQDIWARQDAVAVCMRVLRMQSERAASVRARMRTLPDLQRLLARVHALGSRAGCYDHPDARAQFYEQEIYGKRRVGDLIAILRAFETVESLRGELTNLLVESEPSSSSSLIQRVFDAFPPLETHLEVFRGSFNLAEAEQKRAITPTPGSDPLFDSALAAIARAQRALETERARVAQQLGQPVAFFATAKDRFQLEISDKLSGRLPPGFDVVSQRKAAGGKPGVVRYYTAGIRSGLALLEAAEAQRQRAVEGAVRRVFERFDGLREVWERAAAALSVLDALLALADWSARGDGEGVLCRPTILPLSSDSASKVASVDNAPVFIAEGLRNPLISAALRENSAGGVFVPNDYALGAKFDESSSIDDSMRSGNEGANIYKERPSKLVDVHSNINIAPTPTRITISPHMILLTGPNMGGKSTYLRAACVGAVLAQLGAWVPAERMVMTPVDRIFTRIGASDRIIAGQSTFFVELAETSAILRLATRNSLVILDELGRGTSTFDGNAIAFAVTDHIVRNIGCLTLFATHYHTLCDDFTSNPAVELGHMGLLVQTDPTEDEQKDASTPKKKSIANEKVTFLYRYTLGACPKSYGLNVAKLARLPMEVVENAALKSEEFQGAMKTAEMPSLHAAEESSEDLRRLNAIRSLGATAYAVLKRDSDLDELLNEALQLRSGA